MIASQDRSYFIGASDSDKVIGNWKTATWLKWWTQKIGINNAHFDNVYTLAGTHLEHRILESLGLPFLELDKQFINEALRLRVNLDGNTEDTIFECKTTNKELDEFKLPKKYIDQVQVQMFGSGLRKAFIVVYHLTEEDYSNFFRPVEEKRLRFFPIEYNEKWINEVYLPRHLILRDCLVKGVLPDEATV
jgi:predicted phage-related endonuclease